MAVKVGSRMMGENAAEQYLLEKRRFEARQRPKQKLGDRIKSREEKQLSEEGRSHSSDYSL